MPLLLSMDHTALSTAWPLKAPSSFIMPLPSPSDSYSVLPGYQTQIPSCLCALVYAVPSPRLPFPTFFAKTPPTHSLWLCVDPASSRKCSLVAPGGLFCTWGTPTPICVSTCLSMLKLTASLSPVLCAGWGHHLLPMPQRHLSPSAVCS